MFELLEDYAEALEVAVGVGKVAAAAQALQFEGFLDDIFGAEVGDSAFQGVGGAFQQLGIALGEGLLHLAQTIGVVVEKDPDQLGEEIFVVSDSGQRRFAIKEVFSQCCRLY